MKNSVICAAIIAAMCTACTEDEIVDQNQGRPIDFRSEIGSRGQAVTAGSLTSFVVSAFNGTDTHMDKVEFTKAEGSNFYTSASSYYWPDEDATLSFIAYAPNETNFTGSVTLTSSEQKLKGYTLDTDISNQKDIIYASATGKKSTNETSGVALAFKHAVARIGLSAKNSGQYVYKVAGVKLGNIVSSGDFDFKAEKWTPSSNKESYKKEFTGSPVTLSADKKSLIGTNDYPMVIPSKLTAWNPKSDPTNNTKGAYLAVLVNISNAAGKVLFPKDGSATEYGWVAVPINTEWNASTIYNYTLDFTDGAGLIDPVDPVPGGPEPGEPVFGDPIKFTVTVTDWTTGDVIEPEMTN